LSGYDVVKSTPQPKAKKPSASAAPKAALTISRPEMLVNGSDQEFRRLVHSLFGKTRSRFGDLLSSN
jgi:hypothetical protein